MPSRSSLIFSASFVLTATYVGNSVEAVESNSTSVEYEYEYTDFTWNLGGDISGGITIGPTNADQSTGTVALSETLDNLKLTLSAIHSAPTGDGWVRISPFPGSVNFNTFAAIDNAAGLITSSTLTNSGSIIGNGNVTATAKNSLLAYDNARAFPVNSDTLASSATASSSAEVRRNAFWSYEYNVTEDPTQSTKEIGYTAELTQVLNPGNSGSSINDWTSEFTWSTSVQVPTTRMEYRREKQTRVVPGPWPVFGLVSFVAYARKLKSRLRSCA